MRIITIACALVATTCGSVGALAQEAYYWPVSTPAGAAAQRNYFPMGTPITFKTRTEVNTKQAKPGDRVQLEVAEALSYKGQVVVPVGAPAVAEVASSERNGHFGKKGKLEIRLLYVQTPSGPVRLSGEAADAGRSGTAASVATMVFATPLGFLIHGTSARLPHGTMVTGFTSDQISFTRQEPTEEVATVQPDRSVLQSARQLPTRYADVLPKPGF